ncbi:pentatricopeptide repeat-containing protein At5g15280, mitochondrial [Humulus lupulus]|uniref:pentatricopeptide repeat-containing protein At5g15280, mitochondrial n=1 Tax=Humulus lupulus TaxID=3486 RepID=UPI002B406D20|nr:pentatricopeptide repeat-containing protein At5g15280, mitochondrial [Humulus lupulus]
MRPRAAISEVLFNVRPQALSSLSLRKLHIGSLSYVFLNFLSKLRFSTTPSILESLSPSTATHIDLQSVCFTGIAQSIISRCSHFLENNNGKTFANASLKELLREISDIVPEYTRNFRRVSELKPEDVLQILLGFQFEGGKVGFGARKVEPLWELFKWANEQSKDFEHLPQSCEVMARMLVRAGLLKEVEILLFSIERRGISMDCHEVFSYMIEEYAGRGELESAVSIYDRMKRLGFAPSLSCYCILLDHLVRIKKTHLALRVCLDMVEMGIDWNEMMKATLHNVTRLLCVDGKIQEARNLVKTVMACGYKLSNSAINDIVFGYCEKRDFDDVLSFFFELQCPPDILAGNRAIHSLCSYYGTEMAEQFMHELKFFGFIPDEITLGILIGWSCHEGNLKNSFVYVAEIFAKGLQPHICSYNALIGGLFLKGMWKHARDVFDEMVERGTTPDLSTFRILLAGYCKARQFDEVKRIICGMENCGIVHNLSLEGQLSKAFSVLGFDPLAVSLKRDNGVGLSKTEFFDNLGNGLYLDTDLDEYDGRVTGILEDSLVLDYNSLIEKDCNHGNLKGALALADDMVQWGQELSLSVFSTLLKRLCASRYHIKVFTNILEKNMKLVNLLDQETLNLLVQLYYCKRGWRFNGKIVWDSMLHRHLKLNNETYTAVITGVCKMGNFRDLHGWWVIAREERWVPGLEECKSLLECLCNKGMLNEVLELFENMMVSFPHTRLDVCHLFIEMLSFASFTRVVHSLLEELNERGCVMDHVAYSHLIRGMCEEARFSEALKILECMLAKNLAPCLDVAVILIPKLCKASRHKKAIALKEVLLSKESSSLLLVNNALLQGFCMTCKVGEAASLFQEMSLKGIASDAETYNILVQGHCKVKNIRKVEELLGVTIRKKFDLSISAYRNLVRLMCMEGEVSCALKLKELVLGQSKSHDLVINNILIFSLFSTGNSLFVNEVVDDLQKKKLQLDEVSYNFLVYGFYECKDVSSAFQYLSTMLSKELRPNNRSLRAAVLAQCNGGELEKALELSREMELRGWVHDSIIQNAIVEGLLSYGMVQEAENFLDRLVEKHLIPDSINYDNLIKCFCSHGRLSKAVNLLNIMLKKGNLPSSTSYDSVISSCCSSNCLNEALDFHAEMQEKGLKPSVSTMNIIVHHLCQDGRTMEAERILISMAHVDETPSREMFSSVINRYHFENNHRKASELVRVMQRSGYEPDFKTHWSLITNLRNSFDKNTNKSSSSSQGFLSRLLSESGFSRKN